MHVRNYHIRKGRGQLHIPVQAELLLTTAREPFFPSLQDAFYDASRPLCSVYGAVVGTSAMGATVSQSHLLPHLNSCVARLESQEVRHFFDLEQLLTIVFKGSSSGVNRVIERKYLVPEEPF